MRHITLRSTGILVLGLAVLLLIPVWGAVGVFKSEGGGGPGGGHHGGMGTENAREEFVGNVREFVARNTREDGCVAPTTASNGGPLVEEGHGGEHGDTTGAAGGHDQEEKERGDAPVVYLRALRFGYIPARICLERGRTYELRMMATDITHGASLQLGAGSKMVRLPPGILVTERVTFTETGEYLLYCSYYCGVGHQNMQGRIVVEPRHTAQRTRRGHSSESAYN